MYFDYRPLIQSMVCIFFLFGRFTFHFVDCLYCCTVALFLSFIYYLFMYFIYFFWPRWVLVAACGLFVTVCGLLSSCGMRFFFFSLSSCGVQAPGCVGSVVCGTQPL